VILAGYIAERPGSPATIIAWLLVFLIGWAIVSVLGTRGRVVALVFFGFVIYGALLQLAGVS
jgi:hypothetical protein